MAVLVNFVTVKNSLEHRVEIGILCNHLKNRFHSCEKLHFKYVRVGKSKILFRSIKISYPINTKKKIVVLVGPDGV